MSTTSLTAAEVMDRVANLLNDPAKTDYTYVVQLPYLNMAIDELSESLEESNSSPTNQTSASIVLPVGSYQITPLENVVTPHYPIDLIEVQQVLERTSGSNESYTPVTRRDFVGASPATNFLGVWSWENQIIKFNPNGALSIRDIQLRYIRLAFALATASTDVIGGINARSYLGYKTAALCALFIGENETRASVLDAQADKALDRTANINNKGRQEIPTRHRPFRANWKRNRGGY